MGKLSSLNLKKDFVVAVYIVKDDKILLVNHKKLCKWLPIGGHIELDETPDQAVLREVQEETGLDAEIVSEKYPNNDPNVEMLTRPNHVQLEKIDKKHQHIDFVYVCKIKGEQKERIGTEECKWFSKEDLDVDQRVPENVKFFGKRIIDMFRKK